MKIILNDQHGDASEYRSYFGIYIGNPKHPKLSRRTNGSAMCFIIGHLFVKVGQKQG